MFSTWWRRLKGGEGAAAAAPAAPGTGVATDDGAARAEPAAASAPCDPGPPAPTPGVATEDSLRRSLNWRARVLLNGASPEALASDGPALVKVLRQADESVIRQPPAAAMRALEVARDSESPFPVVAALFEHDPVLAQELLRQANSAYYRRNDETCTSLQAGVQRVGLQGVQDILNVSLVRSMLCRPGGAFDGYVQAVWKHMLHTAVLARSFAPGFGVDPESAYSLALLHDVGKLVLFDHISTLRHERRRDLQFPEVFLRQMLWHLHEPIGGLALLRWGMGGGAAHAVGEHHRRPVPAQVDTMTECLYVAERVQLAYANNTRIDWDGIWKEGGITSDVAGMKDRLPPPEE